MPLNFSFAKTEYFKREGSIWWNEGNYLKPELNSILWNSVLVGVPSLTEKNVDKFINRVRLWEKMHGPTVTDPEGDDTAFDEVVAYECVGFVCNSAIYSKAKFLELLLKEAGAL